MAKVVIPPDLLGQFVSKILPPVAMELSGTTDWGARYIQNSAYFAQFSLSRLWNASGADIPAVAQQFLELVPTARGGAEVWTNPGEALADLADASYAAVDSVLTVLGAQNPIIKIVAKVGLFTYRIFWTKWFESRMPQPAPVGLRYDWDSDQSAQREMADYMSAGDIVSVLLPRVDLRTSGGEIEFRKVQSLAAKKERDWLAIPQGDTLGSGALPGNMGIPWSWQANAQWSDFSPGALSASVVAWELAVGQFKLDKQQKAYIKSEWTLFYGYVAKKAAELDELWKSTGKIKYAQQRGVLDAALRPIKLAPAITPDDAAERAEAFAGVNRPMWGTGENRQGPTMADAVNKVIDRMDIPRRVVALPDTISELPPDRGTGDFVPGRLPSSGAGPLVAAGGAAAAAYFFFR